MVDRYAPFATYDALRLTNTAEMRQSMHGEYIRVQDYDALVADIESGFMQGAYARLKELQEKERRLADAEQLLRVCAMFGIDPAVGQQVHDFLKRGGHP